MWAKVHRVEERRVRPCLEHAAPGKIRQINRALSNGTNVILAMQAHNYEYTPGARGGRRVSAVVAGISAMSQAPRLIS